MISIIVAMADNRVIGNKGKLMWHLRSDLKRFASITRGHTIIMGRKTAEGLGMALPGRLNIAISRNKEFFIAGFLTADSLEKAFEIADGKSEIFIIGGAEIYSLALPRTQKIYLTKVDGTFLGDTCFPELNQQEWRELKPPERYLQDENNECSYSFSILERIESKP
ncbi:MAG: dihydrofolate reductase [Minisyncoccia bacterium]